jgi:hypothetical protein
VVVKGRKRVMGSEYWFEMEMGLRTAGPWRVVEVDGDAYVRGGL